MKLTIALLASTFAFGSAIAQSPNPSTSPNAAADVPASAMMKSDAKRDAAVEHHIADMHAKLKITTAEESQWKEVAETMRENAKDLDKAIDKRDASLAHATAIDDLNAYADIAQAHATGVKRLAKSFSGLYSMMSVDQKKEADEIFSQRNHEGKKVANR
jgi:protein CpxP